MTALLGKHIFALPDADRLIELEYPLHLATVIPGRCAALTAQVNKRIVAVNYAPHRSLRYTLA